VTATSPVRYPDLRSTQVMTRRAWWLVLLNILIPGSAQLLAGNRRLGRFGVGATFLLWALALLSLVIFLAAHTVFYTIVTNPIVLTAVQVAFAAYAILWIVLTLDTLRLVRLIRAAPITRPFIAAVAVLALLATAGGASYGAVTAGSARSAVSQIFAGTTMAPPADGRYNIMLLGGDAGPDRTGLRPDSLSIASVDAVTGATTIIGIPRNLEQIPFVKGSPLYGPFPNGYNCGDLCLIDYLFTYGEGHPALYPKAVANGSLPGVEAMRDSVEGVLGITIQYYALIDMQGFSDLVDALGGVTVTVPTRTPIGGVTGAKPAGWVEAGTQKMNGYTALWYARSRYDSNDFQRMARQRLVQEAILKQFQPSIILSKFQAIAKAGAQVVKTDIPSAALGGFVDLADKARKLPITRLELVPPAVNPGHPDYNAIHQLVATAIAPRTASPAP
jgi:LCP family protein required for cell wall assembly